MILIAATSLLPTLLLPMAVLAQSSTIAPSATLATPASTTAAGLEVATTDVSQSQISAFKADVRSYLSSFRSSPEFTNLAIQLIGLPADVRQSLIAQPEALLPVSGTVDLRSLATDPPLTFPTQSWQTYLNSAALSSVRGAQTSAIVQIASLAQKEVGVTTSISVPTGTSSQAAGPHPTFAAGAVGIMGVAAGAAAFFL